MRPPTRLTLTALAIWLAVSAWLAAFTGRVTDWYLMTDELLYERLAISIAHGLSPLPRVHGEAIASLNQLYPLVIAPVFAHGLVPEAVRNAHILNAFVMASACVPALLLARRVTQSQRVAILVAVLTVSVPWILYASFLLTEVVAYPVFLWAILAVQHATAAPRLRNDLLALATVGLAILGRTQFTILLAVLPAAIVLHELAFAGGESRRDRLSLAVRRAVSQHRALATLYATVVVAAVALAATGRLSDLLGTYSSTVEGDVVPSGIGRSFLEHTATLAVGLGILPFLLGVAWLLGTLVKPRGREQHAFASVGTLALVALMLEVTVYDLRFAEGFVYDRYLFYLGPIVLVGFGGLLAEGRRPRLTLLWPTAVMLAGLALMPVRFFVNVSLDTPVATINDPLRGLTGSPTGVRVFLVAATAITVALVLAAFRLDGQRRVALVLATLALTVSVVETGYAFFRLVDAGGMSSRRLIDPPRHELAQLDRALGTDADVTMIPSPHVRPLYDETVQLWWDLEFWNMSVRHAAVLDGTYTWTPSTFATVPLRFDRETGAAGASPSEYVVSNELDARFRLAGDILSLDRHVALIRTERPWRADWLSLGLSGDGWSTPGVPAAIRVFATPDEREPVERFVTIELRAPDGTEGRPFRVVSNADTWNGKAGSAATATRQLSVCVPPGGFADLRLESPEHSRSAGDPRALSGYRTPPEVGIGIVRIALSNELSAGCKGLDGTDGP